MLGLPATSTTARPTATTPVLSGTALAPTATWAASVPPRPSGRATRRRTLCALVLVLPVGLGAGVGSELAVAGHPIVGRVETTSAPRVCITLNGQRCEPSRHGNGPAAAELLRLSLHASGDGVGLPAMGRRAVRRPAAPVAGTTAVRVVAVHLRRSGTQYSRHCDPCWLPWRPGHAHAPTRAPAPGFLANARVALRLVRQRRSRRAAQSAAPCWHNHPRPSLPPKADTRHGASGHNTGPSACVRTIHRVVGAR